MVRDRDATARLFFEHSGVGPIFEWSELTATEEEILEFGRRYDPTPIHTDQAAGSLFGGLIASGWHVAALMQGMQFECYTHRAEDIVSRGVDEIRWLVAPT